MTIYAGIDLHSSNCYLAVIDEQQRRLFSKRLPNSLDQILSALQPFKEELSGVVVESTYNWYWLVDGLQEQGYGTRQSHGAHYALCEEHADRLIEMKIRI
jgi:transposase